MVLLFILYFIHKLIVVILLFGFLLSPNYLIYYILLWPFMLLHWITNDNKCILYELEDRLNNKTIHKTVFENLSEHLDITLEQTNTIVYNGVTFIWAIALIRIMMFYF
jgi:hypothetical protein